MNNKIEIKNISTEARNQDTLDIDRVSTEEILIKINNEDQKVALAVKEAIPMITKAVDIIVESFQKGGRLIYLGAGTSGRIGVLDASECPPTFGVSPEMVKGIIAGGNVALVKAIEGAEDQSALGVNDLKENNITKNDVIVGLAASGRTPYVLGAITYAKEIGAKTIGITTSKNTLLSSLVDYPIVACTGAEAITGSTRMKSGTAQKLICNMLTTASMIKMGKVYQNLMVDVKATNEKLVARSINIIQEVTSYSEKEAKESLLKYQTIKGVILAHLTKIEDPKIINDLLAQYHGNINLILKERGQL